MHDWIRFLVSRVVLEIAVPFGCFDGVLGMSEQRTLALSS